MVKERCMMMPTKYVGFESSQCGRMRIRIEEDSREAVEGMNGEQGAESVGASNRKNGRVEGAKCSRRFCERESGK